MGTFLVPKGRTGQGLRVFTIDNSGAIPPEAWGAYLAIGNFDGVHRGHAALIARLRERAHAAGAPAIALTFDPPPVAVLRPDRVPPALTTIGRRVEFLQQAGADHVGVFQTGRWLLGLTAREFFDAILVGRLAAKGMVEGPTFGFGRDRGGDSATLAGWCRDAGLDFETAGPTVIAGGIISSSRIRGLIELGDVAAAADLLGRPHRLDGTVVRGEGRGRDLGFPTANLDGIAVQVPADGVYAARAIVDGEAHKAAVHIGPNATFGATRRTVEAFLLDFQGDLYGRAVALDLVARVRPSLKFEGVDWLVRQMTRDVAEVDAILGT